MNPCPCGYYGEERCHCTDYEVMKYRGKISGPILDRIDIQKYVQPAEYMDLSNYTEGKNSKELKEIVEKARKVQVERYKGIDNINCNAQMTPGLIKEFCILGTESKEILKLAYDRFKYSARTYHKFLRVSRTIADIEESKEIRKEHVVKALQCRDLEKEQANMSIVNF